MSRIKVHIDDVYSPMGAAPIFQRLGWFYPAYFTLGYMGRLAYRLDRETPSADQQAVLADAVVAAYGSEHLAAMLLLRYSKLPFLQDRVRSISEAFEAYALGLKGASIVTLLPVIESVLRKHGGGDDMEVGKKHLLGWIDSFIATEKKRDAGGHIDERVAMLGGFRSFIDKRLYARSTDHEDDSGLNRHGIVHGVFADEEYRAGYNFARLVSVLDLLCFVLTLQGGVPCSALAPDLTTESRTLAAYYRQLSSVGAVRPGLP